MIPRMEWMSFAIAQLEFDTPFKTRHQSYDDGWFEWVRAYDRREPEALEVADKYKAYLVTQRLKS